MNLHAHPQPTLHDLTGRAAQPGLRGLPGAADLQYCLNGRAALFQLCEAIGTQGRADTVLVPAYHCPTVVDPILAAGLKVRYYDVGPNLLGAADLLATIDASVRAVLIINYFGFEFADPALIGAIRAKTLLIEDCSHSFYNPQQQTLSGQRGDGAIYSFWKQIPALYGGGVRVSDTEQLALPAAVPPRAGHRRKMQQQILRQTWWHWQRRYLPRQQATAPRQRHQASMDDYPFDTDSARLGMPGLSRRIMQRADPAAIGRRRRENFLMYLDALANNPLLQPAFTELPDNVSPWGFPVHIAQRGRHDLPLRQAGVPLFTFGELPHPHLAEISESFPNANRHREELLVFPVHQQLPHQQVQMLAEQLHAYGLAQA